MRDESSSERPPQKPHREKRAENADTWADTPPKPEGKRHPPAQRATEPKAAPQPQQGARTGFAENVPAFLRKPPRPLKQPGGR